MTLLTPRLRRKPVGASPCPAKVLQKIILTIPERGVVTKNRGLPASGSSTGGKTLRAMVIMWLPKTTIESAKLAIPEEINPRAKDRQVDSGVATETSGLGRLAAGLGLSSGVGTGASGIAKQMYSALLLLDMGFYPLGVRIRGLPTSGSPTANLFTALRRPLPTRRR